MAVLLLLYGPEETKQSEGISMELRAT